MARIASGSGILWRARLGATVALLLWPRPAFPESILGGLTLQTMDDIDQAHRDQDIDDDTRDRLRALLDRPVDPGTADRDTLAELPDLTPDQIDALVAFRRHHPIRGVADLARAAGLDADLAERLRPFLSFEPAPQPRIGPRLRGRATAATLWRWRGAPPGTWMRTTLELPGHLEAGLLMAARPRNGLARSATPGTSIAVPRRAIRFDPAGLYVASGSAPWSWIVGTYRIGFGQRLTFDNTYRRHPDGWIPALDVVESTQAGTVATPDGLLGAAVRYRGAGTARGALDATLFASYRLADVPIGDLDYDRCPIGLSQCTDARKVPKAVDRATGGPLTCAPPTLPWAVHEALGGARIAYRFDARTVLGASGYAAWRRFRTTAPGIRPATSSRFPWDRGVFGAAGLHGTWGQGPIDLAAEVAVTDRGAPAAILAGTIRAPAGLRIAPSVRYYAPGFDNPYARGLADADEFQGIRGRDEVGGRIGIDWRPSRMLGLDLELDVWHHRHAYATCDPDADRGTPGWCPAPTANPAALAAERRPSTDLALTFQTSVRPTRFETTTLRVAYRDEDLARSGRHLSYAPHRSSTRDASGGSRVQWVLRAATSRLPRTRIAIAFRQTFEDRQALQTRFDRSWAATLDVHGHLSPGPTVDVRVQVRDDDTVTDPDRAPGQVCASWPDSGTLPTALPGRCRGETALDLLLRATQPLRLPAGAALAIRMTGLWTRWLDDRARWKRGTPCDAAPSRNAFSVRVALDASF